MSEQPNLVAFLSFAREEFDAEDSTDFPGLLSSALSKEVRLYAGENIDIQAVNYSLLINRVWKERVSNAAPGKSFLIPIITAGYFKDDWCREEFKAFLNLENTGQGAIIPIYYRSAQFIESKKVWEKDELASFIASIDKIDWRDIRGYNFDRDDVKERVAVLARAIAERSLNLRASQESSPVPEESETTQQQTMSGDVKEKIAKTKNKKVTKSGKKATKKQEPEKPSTNETHTADSVPTHQDEPATVDQLGRLAFAQALAERIRTAHHVTEGAFLVNLHGLWGSGKSSILNFIKSELCKESCDSNSIKLNPWIVIQFNAWRYQHSGPAWWSLMDAVYRGARSQIPWYKKPMLIFRENLWRFSVRYGFYVIGAAILIWVLIGLSGFLYGTSDNIVKSVGAVLALIAAAGTIIYGILGTLLAGSARAATTFSEATHNPEQKLADHFSDLIRRLKKPVIVMIDDLDRCDEEYVVELLESVQTLFRHSSITYIVAADRRWLCTSYEKKYSVFADPIGEPGRPLGYLFLEKIFQLSATVPKFSRYYQQRYWEQLVGIDQQIMDEPDYREAVAKAAKELESLESEEDILKQIKEQSRGSLESEAFIHAAVVKLATPQVEKRTEHALQPFAPLLDANPRSMKRFVNAYGVQRTVALLSGAEIPSGTLALWTIISLRWPLLAELLQAHPDLIDQIGSNKKLPSNVPEKLKPLFTDDAVIKVVQGDCDDVHDKLSLVALNSCVLLQPQDAASPVVA